MNFKFNFIFVGFVINVSYVWSSKSPKKHSPIRLIDGVRFSRSETSKQSSTDIRNLHHAFTLQNMTWRDGRVIYKIDKAFNEYEWAVMFNAMEEIESCSCIRFVHFRNHLHQHFVKIRKDKRRRYTAASSIGCRFEGEQPIWFGYERLNVMDSHHVMLHHLLHTLGFFDHLVRSDRDKYIEFHMENTKFNRFVIASEFVKLVDPDPEVEFLTKFDFDSVMMYDEYSHNGKEFITSKTEDMRIPSRYAIRGLSYYDKILLNKLYCPVD